MIVTGQRDIRSMIRLISPPWLRRRYAYRFLYALGLVFDGLIDGAYAGLRARFPGLSLRDGGPPDYQSLPRIGAEWGMTRGLIESNASYALRLRKRWDYVRGAGGPYTMITQLGAFHANIAAGIQILYRSGRRYSLVNGQVIREDLPGYAASADRAPGSWARYSIIITSDWYYSQSAAVLERALNDLRSVIGSLNAAHTTGNTTVIIQRSTGTSDLWGALPLPYGSPPDTRKWSDGTAWGSVGDDSLIFFKV
jgi:hypothetical protein